MSDTIAACKLCYDNDGVIVEAGVNVHRRHPDGSRAEWTLDCPRCGAQVGFGYQSDRGEIDLGEEYS